eukprot:m.72908 g.72908  ORF g.72908 m.72908 type:complete len:83 (+) comp16115_c0_seq15:112-360(+)
MPAASKASRSATRVLDIAARERRIRKRIEKLEEDCGQEENFQDVLEVPTISLYLFCSVVSLDLGCLALHMCWSWTGGCGSTI